MFIEQQNSVNINSGNGNSGDNLFESTMNTAGDILPTVQPEKSTLLPTTNSNPENIETVAEAISNSGINYLSGDSLPDLTIDNGFTVTKSVTEDGDKIEFDYTINNQGGTMTDYYSKTKFYYSKDTILDDSDLLVHDMSLRAAAIPFGFGEDLSLASGESRNESEFALLPDSDTSQLSGDYYIIAKADGKEWINESNENNNWAVSGNTINFGDSLPDLTIDDGFIVTKSVTEDGDKIEFDYTINNQGGTMTDYYSITKFYYSKDTILDDSDLLVHDISIRLAYIGGGFGEDLSLASGESHNESEFALLPDSDTSQLFGDYYIIAEADGGFEFNQGWINESNENNNWAVSGNTINFGGSSLADLTIDDGFTVSKSGDYVQFDYILNNQGEGNADFSYTELYLSQDQTFDKEEDVWFSFDSAQSLAGGTSRTKSVNAYLSSYYTNGLSGEYYVIADSDGYNSGYVSESNEDNNWAVSGNTINFGDSLPDLTIDDGFIVTKSVTEDGDKIEFDYTINNQGGTMTDYYSITKFYYSKDTILDDSDLLVHDNSIRPAVIGGGFGEDLSLASGESRNESEFATLPSSDINQLFGDYYIIAEADGGSEFDDHGWVDESNENNNWAVSGNTINFGGSVLPDLTIDDGFIVTKSGDLIEFDYTINNQGGTMTDYYSKTKFYYSKDQILDSSDLIVHDNSIRPLYIGGGFGEDLSLASGESRNESEFALLPDSDTSQLFGDYYIIAEADGGFEFNQGWVDESNEGNNWAVSGNTIQFWFFPILI